MLTPDEQKVANFLASQQHPAWWVENHLTTKLWSKQIEILESVRDNRRTAVRSSHGAGKTRTAAIAALWFGYTHPDSIVVTTAPTGRQVRFLLWQELRRAHATAKLNLGGELNLVDYKIRDGWYGFGFSTDDAHSFQGIHPESGDILVIIDEACGVSDPIWQAVDAIMSSAGARLLTIANPTDSNSRFARECKSPGVNVIHISAFDTPNLQAGRTVIPGLVTKEWVDETAASYGTDSPYYIARVLGQFPDVSTDTLFPLAWVEAAVLRSLTPKADDPKTLGVDVAIGDTEADESVIATRYGPVVRLWKMYRGKNTMETCGLAIQAKREHGATLIGVDANGVGAGVHHRLLELGEPSEGINVGTGAHDPERFFNRRSEVYWAVRERLQAGDIDLPDDEHLKSQLANIKWRVNSRGQIQVESKPDMRDRLRKAGVPHAKSPDRADAVVLAFAASTSSLLVPELSVSFG